MVLYICGTHISRRAIEMIRPVPEGEPYAQGAFETPFKTLACAGFVIFMASEASNNQKKNELSIY